MSNQKSHKNRVLVIDFTGEKQKPEESEYAIKMIMTLARIIFELFKNISLHPSIQPELIISGIPWKCLQHCFFALIKENEGKIPFIKEILNDSIYTL